jgi:aryl-alcohol dehydrogenase-like predicted oxidoreductase
VNFLDTADLYSTLLNERLVADATAGQRAPYIFTKFGCEVDDAAYWVGFGNNRWTPMG